jgi:hypothetical protein
MKIIKIAINLCLCAEIMLLAISFLKRANVNEEIIWGTCFLFGIAFSAIVVVGLLDMGLLIKARK